MLVIALVVFNLRPGSRRGEKELALLAVPFIQHPTAQTTHTYARTHVLHIHRVTPLAPGAQNRAQPRVFHRGRPGG